MLSPLAPSLRADVLAFLAVDLPGEDEATPSIALLEQLVAAYTRHVPWESAFRIAKRVVTLQTIDCPRWPEEFWQDAMYRGGGGTCFESNYAFFSLLQSLGYEGYLTINNMNELCGCHTAIVLDVAGERWLVDVGIPLYTPIPLATDRATMHASRFHTYTITPLGGNRYEITRDRHPQPYIFTLIDQPVTDGDYRTATTNDYESSGHFLSEVIISKIIDDTVWRFNGRNMPPLLESFGETSSSTPVTALIPQILSEQFSMDQEILTRALNAVGL